MKTLRLKHKLILLFSVSALFFFTACEKEVLPEPPTCTYTKDPDCFCQANPDNPLCNIATCTFELDPDCFCANAPDDPRCTVACTFEDDPQCFCDENPSDSRCSGGVSTGFYTFFDFEDESIIVDSIFTSGFTGDNPDGWQSDGRAVGSIATGDAPQGERYFVNEIEVINEAWAWSSNLFKMENIDASSLSDPTLNFWIRTSNEKPMTLEFAMSDAGGESGWHPGGAYAEVNGTWQLFSIRLAELNNIGWQWGDGIDFNDIQNFKFGFNINGQAQGDIFEVHVDNIYLDDGVPTGAIAYPAIEEPTSLVVFDFESEELVIDSIFATGFTGDNPDGWQSDGRAVASFGMGDAAEGDRYFINELEVINEAWAWTSNLAIEEAFDLSDMADPTFNFWARTSNEKPMTFEFAFVDGTGESGWHPGGAYAEVNGDWQLFSVNLNQLNAEGWRWGDGIDLNAISLIKFGFNINGQSAGDLFEVHVDYIHFADGAPDGAIIYPAAPEPTYTKFHTFFDFESADIIVDSIFTSGFTGDNPDGWQSDGRAVGSIASGTGDAPEGDAYFVNEIEVINEAWAWTSNLFSEDVVDASGLTNPTLNFWIRTSNETAMTVEFAMVDDSGESGYHPGGPYAEINGDWQQVSVRLGDIAQWNWGDGIDFSQITLLKFGFNINGQAAGDIFEVHVDDIHIADGSPDGAIIYPK